MTAKMVVLISAVCLLSTLTGAWLFPSPIPMRSLPSVLRLKSDNFLHYPSLNQRHIHHVSLGERHQKMSRLTRSALDVAGNGDSSSTHHHQAVLVKDETIYEPDNILNKLKVPSAVDSSGLSTQQKVINALFLSAAFGYAIYTILNIDAGLTRGWSASEIAMRIPLDNWGAYESYLANKPIVTKTLINVIIYLLGDWLSQTAFQGKNVLDFDISRTLRNGFIGLCFGPCVHQYYEFSDAILPPENGLVTRLEKILMDQTIYLTIKCSIYICAVGLLAGEDWATVEQRVKDKIQGIVFTAWKFWPLVHCITYSLIPAQHRILWVNSVDLVWNAILATLAQKKESVFDELEGEDEKENQNLSAFGTPTPLLSSSTGATSVTLKTFILVNDTLSAMDVEVLLPLAQDENVGTQANGTTIEAVVV